MILEAIPSRIRRRTSPGEQPAQNEKEFHTPREEVAENDLRVMESLGIEREGICGSDSIRQ